jgi:N-methylhydantoinase B
VQPSDVPGKVSGFALRRGDIVREETAGGGGHGDPLTRDPARVAADVRQGYLSRAQAKTRYGVVIHGKGRIDLDATAAERATRAAARIRAPLQVANADDCDGPRRRFALSAALAARLGIEEGGLIELLTGRATPVRGWVRLADGVSESVTVGPEGLRLIGAAPGEAVEIRAVRSLPPM